jgi:lysophospholipase L1-like esterase
MVTATASSSGGAGGVASNDAGAGVDAGSEYNPCPPKGTPCAVLPLGDSITFGVGSSTYGGYRAPLFHLAVQSAQSITFVGSQTDGPAMVDGLPFPQQSEGHSGFTIADGGGRSGITALAGSSVTKYQPNIVTLMIGTNDVDIGLDLANAPARLGALMDIVLAADPKLLLVVAQIVPTTDDGENSLVQAYNAAVPGLVSTRAASGKHVTMVDMYGAFTAHAAYKTDYMSDKLHPNDAGYAVMAATWYAKIGPLLR